MSGVRQALVRVFGATLRPEGLAALLRSDPTLAPFVAGLLDPRAVPPARFFQDAADDLVAGGVEQPGPLQDALLQVLERSLPGRAEEIGALRERLGLAVAAPPADLAAPPRLVLSLSRTARGLSLEGSPRWVRPLSEDAALLELLEESRPEVIGELAAAVQADPRLAALPRADRSAGPPQGLGPNLSGYPDDRNAALQRMSPEVRAAFARLRDSLMELLPFPGSPGLVHAVGLGLTEACLGGDIGRRLNDWLALCDGPGLDLWLDVEDALSDWPFELMRVPGSSSIPLLRRPGLRLGRLVQADPAAPSLTGEGALVCWADPAGDPESSPIRAQAERVADCLVREGVPVDLLPQVEVGTLFDRLELARAGRLPYRWLHLVAHGKPERLALADMDLPAADLVERIRGAVGEGVFLAACHGAAAPPATPGEPDALRCSLAQDLARQGVSHVLAFASAVPLIDAETAALRFYGRFFRGAGGSVGRALTAVAAARAALAGNAGSYSDLFLVHLTTLDPRAEALVNRVARY